jgi:hypothetical protein
MVLAPIKGIFSYFLPSLALPRLGRFLLPCLIFLLFPFVLRVLLVLCLRVLLVFALITLAGDGAELGIKFESTLQGLDFCSHCHNFSSSGDLAPHFPLVLRKSNLHFAMDIMAS